MASSASSLSSPLPRQIVALDVDRQPAYFRVVQRPDGSFTVRHAAKINDRKPAILCLHPDLLFQREGRLFPRDPEDLELAAKDLFPFTDEETKYCAFRQDHTAVFYALTTRMRSELGPTYFRAPLVIVAPPDPDVIRARLRERMEMGEVCDLAQVYFVIRPPALSAFFRLIFLILLLVFCLYMGLQLYYEGRNVELAKQLVDLDIQYAETAEKYQQLTFMNNSVKEFAKFNDPLYNKTIQKFFDFMAKMPAEVILQTVTFGKGKLAISALGNDARAWLNREGLTPDKFEVTDLPTKDLFKVEYVIK